MQVRPSAFAVPATAQQPTDLPDGPSRRFRVQCHQQKYFASQLGRNSFIDSAVPPHTRGVSRSSRTRGADAVDAAAFCARWDRRAGSQESVSDHRHADERRLLRTAKSCGPDAPTLASSFAEFKSAQPGLDKTYPLTTVAKEPGHRRARLKP